MEESEYYRAFETGAEPELAAPKIIGGDAAYCDQDATTLAVRRRKRQRPAKSAGRNR